MEEKEIQPQAEEKSILEDLGESTKGSGRAEEIRGQIYTMLDRFESKGLATKSEVEKYRQGAEADKSVEGLTGFREWIESKWGSAEAGLKDIQSSLKRAAKDQLISEGEQEDLMKRLVLAEDRDFVGHASAIQVEIRAYLAERAEERRAFDGILKNKLVKNGELKMPEGETIRIPDLKGFLALPLAERKAFLRTMESKLGRRKEQMEWLKGDKERLQKEYSSQLSKARQEGKIGSRAAKDLEVAFEKMTWPKRQKALEALPKELEAHARQWSEIRSALEGSALTRLEKKGDELDLGDLRIEFSKAVVEESARLDSEFGKALEALGLQKILPAKVVAERKIKFRQKNLSDRRAELSKLENGLGEFRAVRREIDTLKNSEERKRIDALYSKPDTDIGIIRRELEGAKSKASGPVEDPAHKILLKVDSQRLRVRQKMAESADKLDEGSKRSVASRLRSFLFGKRQEDYGNYGAHVREARKEQVVANLKSENPSAQNPKTRHEADRKFEETVYQKADGREGRVIKVDFTDAKAVEALKGRGPLDSKKDKITIITGLGSNDRELNLREAKVYSDYLEEKLKTPKGQSSKGQEEKGAA